MDSFEIRFDPSKTRGRTFDFLSDPRSDDVSSIKRSIRNSRIRWGMVIIAIVVIFGAGIAISVAIAKNIGRNEQKSSVA